MAVVGIIAEYNPFHLGHRWQMEEVRRRLGPDTGIICVMSGSWVQRGDCAIAEKRTRAAAALKGGADLILELPLTWAVSSAERFARGGVGLLAASGVVDTLAFGSESGDTAGLSAIADYLTTDLCSERIREALKEGISYASARQRAILAEFPGAADTAQNPNDQLGLEYLKALRGTGITPLAIPRKGAAHDGETAEGIASATGIRRLLLSGENADAFLPEPIDFGPRGMASLQYGERAVLSSLRRMTAADFAALPDCSEGLENRMAEAAGQGCSVEEVCALAKTKRYAYARLRRLAVWGYLGLKREDFVSELPYLRVLGADEKGRALLHDMKKKATLPILTKPADVTKLSPLAQHQFELEARAADLWELCRENPGPKGTEWKYTPVIR